ncbi:MAG: ABC transporter ATP-binding protein [Okeania sp. SIO3B3]|nr:ABC transporter ATP-binding protein [Okeania sp. SIO3B3]
MSNIILDVRDLKVQFTTEEKLLKAVDGISFAVKRGQTLGIVGESGSGKSVTSLAIMGLLLTKSCQISGEIWFNNYTENEENSQLINLLQLPEEQKQEYRGGKIAMIFQEPMSSLNPVYTIGFQLTEAIRFHQNVSPPEARRQAASLLQEVKLLPNDEVLRQQSIEEITEEGRRKKEEGRRYPPYPPSNQKRSNIWLPPFQGGREGDKKGGTEVGRSSGASDREIMLQVNKKKLAMLDRYPHELSGGQLQRVMIAMAISCSPTLLIADEPTTALDVTVQARILELLRELGERRGMSVIFISHDLGVMAEVADTVAVMYQGKIVEFGDIGQIFTQPQHPYTKGLLGCRPPLHGKILRLPTVSDFMEEVTNSNGEIEIREKKIVAAEQQNIDLAKQTAPQTTENRILRVNNLRVGFPVKGMFGQTKRLYMAVNDVSFSVSPGETLGLVGESGCGKSTLARAILQLIPITSGQVFFGPLNVSWAQQMTYEGRMGESRWCQMSLTYQNNSGQSYDWPDYRPVFLIVNGDGSQDGWYHGGYYAKEDGWENGIEGTPPSISNNASADWTWYSATDRAGQYCGAVAVAFQDWTYVAVYDAQGSLIETGAYPPK